MITAKELYEDLKNHIFYDLEKAYTYIFNKYKFTPIKSEDIGYGFYEDTYDTLEGAVVITGLKDSSKRHYQIKCHYALVEP